MNQGEEETNGVVQGTHGTPLITDEELDELRSRVRRQLEEEERQKQQAKVETAHAHSAKARRIREIEQDEEARFYSERGYRRFVDKVGNARWLSTEQYAKWEEERDRQQRRKRDPRYHMGSPKTRKIIVFAVSGVALALLFFFLAVLRRG